MMEEKQMKVRMQKLNMVKYADSEARVKELEKQGYKKFPARKADKPGTRNDTGKPENETGEGNG